MSFSKKFASIKLDEIESKITNLLLSVTENLKGSHPNLTLRIAGGWVRDKLLGIPSHDIDIALNDMSGIDFATCIYEFSKSFDSSIVGSHVSKIKSNPNKSKHLETATVKLFGLDVDFVHLRSESYTEGSRIPTIAFGTPKEDASRRDLTINSLFYNIHTGTIEDFLEMGLSDLENGIIRTPLDPFDTFKDDPLRILRTIRFASRFEFTIIDQIRDAVKNPVIRNALSNVISKERIGEELKKMLCGPRPLLSLEYLYHFGIFDCVFGNIMKNSPCCMASVKSLEFLLENNSKYPFMSSSIDATVKRNLFVAAILSGCLDINLMEDSVKHNLMFSNKDSDMIVTLNVSVQKIVKFIEEFPELLSSKPFNPETNFSLDNKRFRRELGVFLRSTKFGDDYMLLFLYAASRSLSSAVKECPVTHDSDIFGISSVDSLIDPYLRILDIINHYNISKVHLLKPVLDGNRILSIVGKKTGKWVSEVTNRLLEWQLEEMENASEALAEKYIVNLILSGVVKIEDHPSKKPKTVK